MEDLVFNCSLQNCISASQKQFLLVFVITEKWQ